MSEAVREKGFEELYDELCKLPDNVVGQILDGELVVSPRPAFKHTTVSSTIGGILNGPFQHGRSGPGGWWILDEPEVHLESHVFVPDLAGWKKERMPKGPDVAYFELAPDWVCEVLSPSSVRYDRVVKMNLYAQFKIPHYWIVDPVIKTLEVFTLESGPLESRSLESRKWVLEPSFEGSDTVSAPPFEAIEFDLGDLWSETLSQKERKGVK